MIYVKLGGSLITPKKERRRGVREEVIRNFSRDLMGLVGEFEFFLAHGAGPYGHDPVLKYGLKSGLNVSNRIGASETMTSVSELNLTVARIMVEERIPIAPFPARSMFRRYEGRISCDLNQVRGLLKAGLVPLTHGDLIPDSERGVYVLSADEIPLYLLDLGLKQAIFLIDEPGVLDREGNLIPVFGREGLSKIRPTYMDATGSIRGKLEAAVKLAEMGVEVRIAGYRERGDFIRALRGEWGTRVVP